jgi:hypothetical protein
MTGEPPLVTGRTDDPRDERRIAEETRPAEARIAEERREGATDRAELFIREEAAKAGRLIREPTLVAVRFEPPPTAPKSVGARRTCDRPTRPTNATATVLKRRGLRSEGEEVGIREEGENTVILERNAHATRRRPTRRRASRSLQDQAADEGASRIPREVRLDAAQPTGVLAIAAVRLTIEVRHGHPEGLPCDGLSVEHDWLGVVLPATSPNGERRVEGERAHRRIGQVLCLLRIVTLTSDDVAALAAS